MTRTETKLEALRRYADSAAGIRHYTDAELLGFLDAEEGDLFKTMIDVRADKLGHRYLSRRDLDVAALDKLAV